MKSSSLVKGRPLNEGGENREGIRPLFLSEVEDYLKAARSYIPSVLRIG